MNASPFFSMKFPQPLIFFLIAILLILVSIIPGNNNTVDIHVTSKFYVMPASLVERQLALEFIILGAFCYFIYKLPVSKAIAWIHLLLTLAGLIVFLYSSFFYSSSGKTDKVLEYNRGMQMMSGKSQKVLFIAASGFALMILAQIILFINLMFGLLRQFNRY